MATVSLSEFSGALADLVTAAAPSVVSVGSGRRTSSGFVWRSGWVVTAEETLPEEDTVAVTFTDGSTVGAKVAGRDASTDIALLQLEAADAPALGFSTDPVRAGMLAVAVGASDDGATVALGVVSRAGAAWRSLRGGEIDSRIVLDVRLPRSAEGGPVLDTDGQAIGMGVFGPRRRVLVIPASTIERVAAKLESHGRIPRGYLGVGLHPVEIEGGDSWGAMIMSLDPEGPSAASGLHQGDVIVSWNGEPVTQVRTLLRALGPDSVGQTVTLGLKRGGETQDVRVTVAERPAG